MNNERIPNTIYSGKWGKCHCQGACIDTKREYAYFSFTTKLVKVDMKGNVIGSVDNIVGHLGCMDFCDADGKVYASLEYKNDEIGRGILRALGIESESLEDAFYIAIFDVDKIDRIGMDAEKDGIMRAVYLKKVVDDFKGTSINFGKKYDHVHGCSGIDGLTIGKDFGAKDDKYYLTVCYGIYSDENREDNDYQVLLQYDMSSFWDMAKPLNQRGMHRAGPENPRNVYFFFTGNTTYGIQNLEYDEYTGDYFVFVYRGRKEKYPNYHLFVIDGKVAPREEKLKGYENFTGKVLTHKNIGKEVNGSNGTLFPLGDMGAYSIGDGHFMFVDPVWDDPDNLSVHFDKYKLDAKVGDYTFTKVK